VSVPLLLDEMFSDSIAQQLRAKGHDVHAVVADPSLVTANIKDFMPLDATYRAAGQEHAGLILVSAKTFPQNRSYTSAITNALAALLDQPAQIHAGQVTFLPPH
jgi:hypothetical protein